MGTNTTKLLLFKPDGSEFVARITDLNDNWDKIDAAFGVTFCTSSTRPSTGLTDGRLIYETDTSGLLVYRLSVTNWVYLSTPVVANNTARDALTPVFNGMIAVTTDTNTLWQRKSGSWVNTNPYSQVNQLLKMNILSQSGTYLTTSGTTELSLAKLSLTGVSASSTAVLNFIINLRLSTGTATDTFELTIRRTTALSGTILGVIREIVPSANQYTRTFHFPWITGGTVTNESFHLSLVKITGSGNLSVEGNSRSSFGVALIGDTSVVTAVP